MAAGLHAVPQSVSNDRRRSTGSRPRTASDTPTVALQPIELAALLQTAHPPITDAGEDEAQTVEMVPLVCSGLADEDEDEPTQPGQLARGTTPLERQTAPTQPTAPVRRSTPTKVGRRARETRRSREILRVTDITPPPRRKP